VLVVVFAWAIRLTGNWAYGWHGMRHEDWRYVNLAQTAGVLWWPLSLAGIHVFPTIVVFLGCLALYPALIVGNAPVGLLDYLALLLGLAATTLEFQADRELHQFRAARRSRCEVLTTGVWAWCRHPNYLGEIGFWVSLFIFGCAAWGGIYPWTWLGPVAMIALFLGISIPMIEKRLAADKPGYAAYRAKTRRLIPGIL
jgi:steroid 5-alpha reductase family enzyme